MFPMEKSQRLLSILPDMAHASIVAGTDCTSTIRILLRLPKVPAFSTLHSTKKMR